MPTIQDIAAATGLSRNTVSKALKDDAVVTESTKRTIVNTALKLGYEPEQAIIDKYGPQSRFNDKMVMVLVLNDKSPFWTGIIIGLNEVLHSEGYIARFHFLTAGEDVDAGLIQAAQAHAGIVFLSVFPPALMERFVGVAVPIVRFDMIPDDDYGFSDVVLLEGVNAVREMTMGLLNQGIKRIGFIGDTTSSQTIKDRYFGYLRAMESAGAIDKDIIFYGPIRYRYYNRAEMEKVVSSMQTLPEAVVCGNDAIAQYLISTLTARGVRVPEDVAVTGYDDVEPLLQGNVPFITTVHFNHERIGRRIAMQLLWRIANPNFGKEILTVCGEVVKRASSDITK